MTRTLRRRAPIENVSARPEDPFEEARAGNEIAKFQPVPKFEKDILETLSRALTAKQTGLDPSSHKLLVMKQRRLSKSSVSYDVDFCQTPASKAVIDATLVFGQEEAGTAVCISPDGLLLTCSHCVAEDETDVIANPKRWLMFSSGRIVQAECRAWDGKRDLALMQIIAAQPEATNAENARPAHEADSSFPFASLRKAQIRRHSALLCVGHPGSEDLETVTPGLRTGYDVLHASSGRFRGYSKDQDIHDNSEIGALMHDCWTYWGHSGAPIAEEATGLLIGLHSSWDEVSGMRRGVALEAITAFLELQK